jgi:RNA polymerase sigma factor (sigma-70 family)
MLEPRLLSMFFRAHAAQLVLYARQINAAHAADAVQEAFVALMQQPREPRNVKAWLYRAVRNAALSIRRSEGRRDHRHLKLAELQQAWFEHRPENVIDAETAQAVLATLPAAQREVIVLRLWAEMGFAEVATLMGLPPSTVYDHYRDGLAALRQKMESSCHTKKN